MRDFFKLVGVLLLLLFCGCCVYVYQELQETDNYEQRANSYYDQGEYAEAAAMYVKAIDSARSGIGTYMPDTKNVSVSFWQLALCYKHLGEYDKAIDACKENLRIKKKLLPAGSVKFGGIYDFLGDMYRSKGEHKDAIAYYRKALGIMVPKLGQDSPRVQELLNYVRYLENKEKISAFTSAKKLLENVESGNLKKFIFLLVVVGVVSALTIKWRGR